MKLRPKCIWCRIKKYFNLCLNTKSSIFLLAYILFLIYSLFVYRSWDEETSKRIITAIIVASAFFSIAELFYTLRELKNREYAYTQDLLAISIKAIKELREKIEKLEAEQPELSKFSNGQNVVKVSVDKMALMQKNQKIEHEQEVVDNLNKEIEKLDKLKTNDSIVGNIAMIIGILLFLVLMTTDITTAYANIASDYLTVVAFLVVVITYYVKQLYFTNTRDEIAEIRLKSLMGEKFE